MSVLWIRTLCTAIAPASALSMLPLVAFAATYTIYPNGSGDFPTIQAAVDAAGDADVIELADGTFTGAGNHDIDFGGTLLVVRAMDGAVPVIDCQGAGRGFWFHTGETPLARVEGLVIANGTAAHGGGILCDGASPSIVGNTIRGCSASGDYGGAGIFCGFSGASPVITGNVIVNNTSTWGSAGIYVYESDSDPVITGNTVAFNTTTNTNVGGGIYIRQASDVVITNNILCFNNGRGLAGALGSEAVVSCNDVFGNTVANYYAMPDLTGVDGNVSADPMFCGAASGNFGVDVTSPCAPSQSGGCGLIGAIPPSCGFLPPPDACFDFNESPEGLFNFEYPDAPGYAAAGIPVLPHVMAPGDAIVFTVRIDEGAVNEFGSGTRVGLATYLEYFGFLGVSLNYDGVLYRLALNANGESGTDFVGEVGATYQIAIHYDGVNAQLVVREAGDIVFSDAVAYREPLRYTIFQVGNDYPGSDLCGTENYEWDSVNGEVDFCVDRNTAAYLRGAIDDIGVPRCDTTWPGQPCQSFTDDDGGLFAYEYDSAPGYQCGGIEFPPRTLEDGDRISFEFAVADGLVPTQFGTGTRIGCARLDDYTKFVGAILIYDDELLYRAAFGVNTDQGAMVAALDVGKTYIVEMSYLGGMIHARMLEKDTLVPVLVESFSYSPEELSVFQFGVDYPGSDHCGESNYWWDDGCVHFCVDRNTGAYLEGCIDNVIWPGCVEPLPSDAPEGLSGLETSLVLSAVPNPMSVETGLYFVMASSGTARLEVFDVNGRLVRSLVDGQLSAGAHRAAWNGRDSDGAQCSGVYYVRLATGNESVTTRVVVTR